jgi:hypothetical protein
MVELIRPILRRYENLQANFVTKLPAGTHSCKGML